MEQFEIVVRLRGVKSIISSFAHTENMSIITDTEYAFMLVEDELEKIIKQLSGN